MRFLFTLVCLLLCCSKSPSKPTVSEAEVVARVGDKVFTVADVQAQLRAQPEFVRARYSTPERLREFVDSLVRTELLLQEAQRQGVDKRPEVRALVEKVMVQQLVSDVARKSAPNEADARAYYDTHAAEFSKPERVRVAVLEFGGTAKAPPPDKALVQKELNRIRALKAADQGRAFAALVQMKSTHESSRGQEGDVGPRTREELAQQFSAQVAAAAFGLTELGAISEPVESPRGLTVVRLLGKQPGEQRPFENEKVQLLMRLTAEARTKTMENLVLSLRNGVNPVINEKALEQAGSASP